MRTLSVFGATGSIGQTTLKLLDQDSNDFSLKVITGGSNVKLLAEMAQKFRPEHVVIADEAKYAELKELINDRSIQVGAGRKAILNAARHDVDSVMSAIVGFAGFEVSLIAAAHCKTLALANKESVVSGGQMLVSACKQHQTNLIPVDSEHSAIFQCLQGEEQSAIERVTLTASGGPFRKFTRAELETVDPAAAAKHPNWSMGMRISIDSASLFNKAMEVIEAKELFNLNSEQIDVLVHPQSIVHSMVGFVDGNVIAQLGPPDMSGAIHYALNWPKRRQLKQKRLDISQMTQLTFEPMDEERFPAVSLAHRAMAQGGCSGAVFNAAKEQALDLFLDKEIGFLDMGKLVDKALCNYESTGSKDLPSLEVIKSIDTETRRFVKSIASQEVANV